MEQMDQILFCFPLHQRVVEVEVLLTQQRLDRAVVLVAVGH
jgi:hypothetical protein